jgi:hypothetical protein
MKSETLDRINPIFSYIVKRLKEEGILEDEDGTK